MHLIRTYLDYLKDNPQGYWFRRKLYGWGWTPARWQGWATLAIFTGVFAWILVPFLNYATEHQDVPADIMASYLAKVFIWVFLLIAICYKTGEPPKWQWGFPDKKDS